MSTLAKIIAFIMLICAVAFAMTAYVLQQQATNWMADFKKLEADSKADILKLKDSIKKLEDDLAKANVARDDAQKLADGYNAELAKRDTANQAQVSDIKRLTADNGHLQDDVTAINNTLKTQANDIKRLQTEKDDAVAAKNKALEAQRKAEDQQRLLEDDIAKYRDQLKLSKADLKSASDVIGRYHELYGEDGIRLTSMTETPPAKIQGQVVNADNASGIVLISVGKDDGVSEGMTFEVSRGAQFVGRLRVTDTHGQEAVCRIDRPMTTTPVQEGDHVTTRVK